MPASSPSQLPFIASIVAVKRIPNLLTLSRILLAPVVVVLFLQEDWLLRVAAIGLFSVAAITDYLDGYLARLWKVNSEFGNFMDPLADKVLTFLAFATLSLIDASIFPWWVFALIVGRDLLITFMRTRARKQGFSMKTSYSAKLKTAIQLIFLYIALLAFTLVLFPSLSAYVKSWLIDSGALSWLYFGVMAFTVYTGLEYLNKNRDLFLNTAPRRS